ncbi:MAG: hypothetical protein OXH64_04365 [Rhodospirillaceae bacterium]|nr:hypothetical protein [Rhodospirillaceae bacterium]
MASESSQCWVPKGSKRERIKIARERWKTILRLADRRPWLRYMAVLDSRTSEEHRRWHGTILR